MNAPVPSEERNVSRRYFERWVKRTWHKSFRVLLHRTEHGVYPSYDLQQAWFAWDASWRSRNRRDAK